MSAAKDHRPAMARPQWGRPVDTQSADEVTGVRVRPASCVPRVLVTPHGVRQLPIDPRVAFLLSRIDGTSTVETLVDVTGFDADEVASMLARLARLGAVLL